METKSTNRKTFQLTENSQQLGELIYEHLFSFKAKIKLQNSEFISIQPVGFFKTGVSVTKNGAELANLTMNWRGHISISFRDGQEYMLKPTGMFYNKFVIENKAGERLIQLDPKFSWSKFDYNYDIQSDKKSQDILLILLGVYASNYFISFMSGMA
ncbi:hypothetical protein [Fibrella arboris]|uniref:hypothetical protein n=1 Tax=Fibrella arboris TaxID=3242486 RepID=UPI003522849D